MRFYIQQKIIKNEKKKNKKFEPLRIKVLSMRIIQIWNLSTSYFYFIFLSTIKLLNSLMSEEDEK